MAKIATQLVLILYVLAAAALDWQPRPLFAIPVLVVMFTVPIATVSNLFHYALLSRATHPKPDEAGRLQTESGLFRYVRHPMYLGDLVMVSSFVLIWCTPFSLALLVLFMPLLLLLARSEDDQLSQQFGQQHQAWREKTRLLIPFTL